MGRSSDTRPGRVPRLLLLAPLAVLLLYGGAPAWVSGIREDEVQCEEAKAHLLDCCHPFTGSLECEFVDGCGLTFPDLDVEQSRALQNASCEEIRRDGVCQTNFTEAR